MTKGGKMGISEFTIKLIILFFPGIVAFVIIDKLTQHKKISNFYVVIYSFILGLVSYLIYFIITILGLPIKQSFFVEFLKTGNPNQVYDPLEIGYATVIAIIVAIVFCYLKNFDKLFWIPRKLRITNKFSDPDVLRHLFNPLENWIYIRDLENDICYLGWLIAFSDNPDNPEDKEELLLKNTIVYKNSTGNELYRTGYTYLNLDRKMIVELAESQNKTENKKKGESNGTRS